MNQPEIDALRREVQELKRRLEELSSLPEEVRQLRKRIEELEEQLESALEENRKLHLALDTVSKGVTTLVVAVKGDVDFRRKGIVDDIATLSDGMKELKSTVDGLVTIRTKVLAVTGFFTVVGLPLLLWAAKNMDAIIKLLEK